ncbi:MAG TPA: DUF3710 domain-containing protein [Candidatus Eisenbacteria bacterium]|nr:DUF3710 domain-containing protein [Candidatus Eisenbacteria bacterium]
MSVFRRRRRDETGPEGDPELFAGDEAAGEVDEEDAPDVAQPPAERQDGPFDVAEVADPAQGRVDLGGVWIPGSEGLEVRVEADQATGAVVAVTLVLADSALQVQPFAAPRTEGIWAEVRNEIRAGITQQGGTADEAEGPFGAALRTRVPVRREDGAQAIEPARFLGVDGPRWFLRGVLTGRAAVEPGADEALLRLFRDVVVVRGSSPMAPRDPIPLRLPTEAGGQPPQAEENPLNPFQRGPEITEIR